jgi:hypothetical protein
MNKNDQQFMAQKIRAQYMEKEASELDELRKLDTKVKRPAEVFAYIFGSVSAIIMGAGMSLVMTPIAEQLGFTFDPMLPGIIVGVVGLVLASVNYPIYKGILGSRKKKFGAKILELSNQIMNGQKTN